MTLRPLELKDAPNFVHWFRDPEVINYTLFQKPVSLKKERKFISDVRKEKNHVVFSIFDKANKHIGSTGLRFDTINKKVVFGIIIGEKREWGKGYAGEIIGLLGDYVFKKLKYNRLELMVFMENRRALWAYKKAGFKLEGIHRKVYWHKRTRQFRDEGMMSILRSEWMSR